MVAWDQVTHGDVLRAIREYDRLGPERFFSEHGFAPTTTYELVWDERRYPPKAILGTAYEFATGQRLGPVISRAGRPGPSRCSESLDSPSTRDDQPGKADPHVRMPKKFRHRRQGGYSRTVLAAA
jgi:hypothetical protein